MENKKYNILITLLALCISFCIFSLTLSIVVLCTNVHSHKFAEDWSNDSMYHWKASTCGHLAEKSREEHIYEENDSQCDVCGYVPATQGLAYSLNDEGDAYTVTGFGNATAINVNIPKRYKGKPVTIINYGAFSESDIYSVILPDSITIIEEQAFSECSNLSHINIPEEVTYIGDSAFSNCKSLTSITIPDSVSQIGSSAFYDCIQLTIYCQAAAAPEDWAVNWNSNATVIWDCRNNDKDTVGYAYTVVNGVRYQLQHGEATPTNQALNLTDVKIPDVINYNNTKYLIKNIHSGIFNSCKRINSITVDSKNEYYKSENNCLLTKDGTELILGCENSIIPYGVTEIGYNAFSECTGLTEIAIPNSVIHISNSAFYNCINLQEIVIPDSVEIISSNAFCNCYNLNNVSIGTGVTTIGNSAFRSTAITEITIPDNVKDLGDYAFETCRALTSVKLGNSITTLNEGVFANCNSLKGIVIPGSVKIIGKDAFSECGNLIAVLLNEGLEKLDDNAFLGCGSLVGIDIPNTVTSIGDSTFKNCVGLINLHIGKGVTSVERNSLTGCAKIAKLTVSEENKVYSSVDNCLLTKDGKTLLVGNQYGTIPEGVQTVNRYLYRGNLNIEKAIIPNSVTTLESWVFADCTNLTSVVIADSVTSIGAAAFRNCTNLSTIKYEGTAEQWALITKGLEWANLTATSKVICSDGEVNI